MELTTSDHDRDVAGTTYVYPVVSRRAGGVSVGVNLNPNDACNWRCIYCQVPGLKRGAGPEIDLGLLRAELDGMLARATSEAWLERNAPAGMRRVNDVAFSGNGEPTTSPDFVAAVRVVAEVLEERGLAGELSVVLITNGSQVHREEVRSGLERLSELGGEVWYKLDAGTAEGRLRLNDVSVPDERVIENLVLASRACRVRLQTMVLALDGEPPATSEVDAWLELVARARARGAEIEDVLVYGPERESHQPEAPRISRVPDAWVEAFAERVREELGLEVRVFR